MRDLKRSFPSYVSAATFLLVPQYGSIVSRIAIAPQLVGELAIIAWLLIWGAKERPIAPMASAVGMAGEPLRR